MARLFPLRTETSTQEGTPRVVDLEGDDADAVFGALSSTTARQIYQTLHSEPGTPSDVADSIDSSIQNVRYHLEKLENAGLVEVVDTWYSSRGNEMSVYATADGPLIVTSDRSRADQLRDAVSRFVGGIGVLLGASLLVQYGLTSLGGDDAIESAGDDTAAPAGDDSAELAGEDSPDSAVADSEDSTDDGEVAIQSDDELTESEDGEMDRYHGEDLDDGADSGTQNDSELWTTNQTPEDTDVTGPGTTFPENGAESSEALIGTLPPGLLFFFGGLTILIVLTVWWYWSTY